MPGDVAGVFDRYPPAVATTLRNVRRLIFDVAGSMPGVGALAETLKWGEPAYLTQATGSGSTIRLGRYEDARCAVYVNCRTNLIERFRQHSADAVCDGRRALVLEATPVLPAYLADCIGMALVYHRHHRVRVPL